MMGTNFYANKIGHIGKRSAAGLYCFDCNETLCPRGKSGVHTGGWVDKWYDACPVCGKKYKREGIEKSTAGLELGFAKPRKRSERKGIKTCSSFSWDVDPMTILKLKVIKDEYGRKYTFKEFIEQVIDNCPIQFYDSIGRDFS